MISYIMLIWQQKYYMYINGASESSMGQLMLILKIRGPGDPKSKFSGTPENTECWNSNRTFDYEVGSEIRMDIRIH